MWCGRYSLELKTRKIQLCTEADVGSATSLVTLSLKPGVGDTGGATTSTLLLEKRGFVAQGAVEI